jgi:hypothetical protein
MLTCRCAYADLLKRLGVAEIEAERSRRAHWESSLVSWRTLRSEHAVQLFQQRIRSSEFADPPERLKLFESMRSWQQDTMQKARQHVEVS